MRFPLPVVIGLIVILGFLTGSSLYYYNKNRTITASKSEDATFSGEIPTNPTPQKSKIDELTVPGIPKGHLSYPANTYKVLAKETLFAIGSKFGISYQLIKAANNITNENSIQADDTLIIPHLDPNTEYYRVSFLINESRATDLNQELRDKENDDNFDPKFVAKRDALSYFKVSESDEFTLVEEDLSKGTALIKAEGVETLNYIGLIQPRVTGKKGFWAVLYVEQRIKK